MTATQVTRHISKSVQIQPTIKVHSAVRNCTRSCTLSTVAVSSWSSMYEYVSKLAPNQRRLQPRAKQAIGQLLQRFRAIQCLSAIVCVLSRYMDACVAKTL